MQLPYLVRATTPAAEDGRSNGELGIVLARLPSMGRGGLMPLPLPLLYQAQSAVNVPALFSGVATLMAVIQAAVLTPDRSHLRIVTKPRSRP